ncbi:MAG: hypothetical protein MHMPM18_000157 [Marteilia pararefringens]
MELTDSLNLKQLEVASLCFKRDLLSVADVRNLKRCDSLHDAFLFLKTTKYSAQIDKFSQIKTGSAKPGSEHRASNANMASVELNLQTHMLQILKKSMLSDFNEEFHRIINLSSGIVKRFMEYLNFPFMINNSLIIMYGIGNKTSNEELSQKIHPIGIFPELNSLKFAKNIDELINVHLRHTQLYPFFKECSQIPDILNKFDADNLEIIRNLIEKNFLEQFYKFTLDNEDLLGCGPRKMLEFEINSRILLLLLNCNSLKIDPKISFRLLPKSGSILSSQMLKKLSNTQDPAKILNTLNRNHFFKKILSRLDSFENNLIQNTMISPDNNSKHDITIDSKFMSQIEKIIAEIEFEMYVRSFRNLNDAAKIPSYFKLKEIEIRNLIFILDCLDCQNYEPLNNEQGFLMEVIPF